MDGQYITKATGRNFYITACFSLAQCHTGFVCVSAQQRHSATGWQLVRYRTFSNAVVTILLLPRRLRVCQVPLPWQEGNVCPLAGHNDHPFYNHHGTPFPLHPLPTMHPSLLPPHPPP